MEDGAKEISTSFLGLVATSHKVLKVIGGSIAWVMRFQAAHAQAPKEAEKLSNLMGRKPLVPKRKWRYLSASSSVYTWRQAPSRAPNQGL